MKNQIEKFYAIKMLKSPFYLMATDSGSFVWDDKENSLCFQTAEQAESFAENYFTKFLGWEVVEVGFMFS